MKRIIGLVFMGLAAIAQAQKVPLQALDSLLLLPFPHDTLHFDGEAWVNHSGQIGRLLWTPNSWAWNADTAQAHRWQVRLTADAPLLTIDLNQGFGTQFATPPPADQGNAWNPSGDESSRLGTRTRRFTVGGDTLEVAAASNFPPANVVANWHRFLEPAWRDLLPLPRQVTPLGFSAADGTGWSLVEVNPSACSLNTDSLWLYDPNRTLMDVVRERKAHR